MALSDTLCKKKGGKKQNVKGEKGGRRGWTSDRPGPHVTERGVLSQEALLLRKSAQLNVLKATVETEQANSHSQLPLLEALFSLFPVLLHQPSPVLIWMLGAVAPTSESCTSHRCAHPQEWAKNANPASDAWGISSSDTDFSDPLWIDRLLPDFNGPFLRLRCDWIWKLWPPVVCDSSACPVTHSRLVSSLACSGTPSAL